MSRPRHVRRHALPVARHQRGLATLAVVMVLLFVISLVAAYTNRNLIFEQRTSINQFRTTQTFEVAQAGLDWAMAQLNGGRIDASCAPTTNSAFDSFRERYLNIDATTGAITPRINGAGLSYWAACVFNGTGWNCSCPGDGTNPAPTLPTGNEIYPAFAVRFFQYATPMSAGLIRLEAVACTRFDTTCLDFNSTTAIATEGRSKSSYIAALFSSAKTLPAAAVAARDTLTTSGTVVAINQDIPSGGIAVLSGGPIVGTPEVHGPPGTPDSFALAPGNSSLHDLTAVTTPPLTVSDRAFATQFGLSPTDFRGQPAAFIIDNCPCDDTALRAAIADNPGRPFWVDGDLTISNSADLGSSTHPIAVFVAGNVTASAGTVVRMFGLLALNASAPTITGDLSVQGAAVSDDSLTLNASTRLQFVYDRTVLTQLRNTTGSFVPGPSSWKDFE